MPFLEVLEGIHARVRFEVSREKTVLGRSGECDILLSDEHISRQHAVIHRRGDRYLIEDLGSSNGTYVNETQLAEVYQLQQGDVIGIEQLRLRFHHSPADASEDRPTILAKMMVAEALLDDHLTVNSRNKLRALLQISSSLGDSLSLECVLQQILKEIVDVFQHADRVLILLSDDGPGRLEARAVWTRDNTPSGRIENHRVSNAICNEVMSRQAAILSTDATCDDRFAASDSVVNLRIRSVVCSPLLGSTGSLLGVMYIDRRDSSVRFNEEDLDLLASIASLVGHAIENTVLHEQLRQSHERLEARVRERTEELEQSHHVAREAIAQRDRFLAMLSHELRNPLNAITAAGQVLLGHLNFDENPCANAARVIERQTEHMGRLLEDLLDLSRVIHNKIELQQRFVDLRTIATQAVEALQPEIAKRRIRMHLDLPDQPLCVHVDPARTQQIICNLLTNAAKYSNPGKRIWLKADKQQAETALCVRDEGIGISQNLLPHVFDLFVQSSTSLDRSNGGMGVGLTLVRSLTELQGGTIQVASDGDNQGSTFTLLLPGCDPRRLQQERTLSKDLNVTSMRIVLVEDNPDSRQMLQWLLELQGAEVSVAVDGLQGYESIVRDPPDLAIVDIGLPKLNGFEVAEKVRHALGANTPPLIALTGYAGDEDRQSVQRSGFDAYLMKPLKIDELVRSMRELTHREDP